MLLSGVVERVRRMESPDRASKNEPFDAYKACVRLLVTSRVEKERDRGSLELRLNERERESEIQTRAVCLREVVGSASDHLKMCVCVLQ